MPMQTGRTTVCLSAELRSINQSYSTNAGGYSSQPNFRAVASCTPLPRSVASTCLAAMCCVMIVCLLVCACPLCARVYVYVCVCA